MHTDGGSRAHIFVVVVAYLALCNGEVDPSRNCTGATTPPPTRVDTTDRVRRLREKMALIPIDALIIPTDDEHQNEYVASSDKKRVYISGFSGSAGVALVTATDQFVWTDGRYFDQAADELDCNWWLMRSGNSGVPTLTGWIKTNLTVGSKVGADPRVTSTSSWLEYEKTFAPSDISMVEVGDLVGQVWDEDGTRPAAKNDPVFPLEMKYAGKSWQDKVEQIKSALEKESVDSVVVSALDEIAWLYNLRGSDISYNPVFFAFAVIDRTENFNPKLYLRAKDSRLSAELQNHLNCNNDGSCSSANCVEVLPYLDIDNYLKNDADTNNKTVWISGRTNYHLYSLITDKLKVNTNPSPLLLPKAIKNSVERDGMRKAHIRDSAVIADFISRLERELDEGVAWNELKVAHEIDSLRMQQPLNKGLSFNTIAGSGKNGAIIHYSPSDATVRAVDKNHMLLLDSGGQYLDGTTDITRTFHFGTPTEYQKLAYTLVLLGVIDLATAVFPTNRTLGSSLDSFARASMWKYGLDFGHGTGHGIGMYLNVHEGPASIGPKRASLYPSSERAVYDGMFFSDEPGYYDMEKGFGIRLETIVMAKYVSTEYGEANRYLTFEPIAFVPFERNLINLAMLSREQRVWLNEYHSLCRQKVGSYLTQHGKTEAYNWLKGRTEPVPLDDQTTNSPGTTPNAAEFKTVSYSLLILALAVLFY